MVLSALTPHAHGGSSSDAPAHLGLYLGVGIPVFVAIILAIVFAVLGRAIARQVAQGRAVAEREGIVRDSGLLWMTVRFSNFRAPGVYTGAGIRKTRAQVLLTREKLHFLPASRSYGVVAKADLGRFRVKLDDDGALRLVSDSPPNASGSIDFRLPVQDAPGWAAALVEAGVVRA